MLVSRRGFLSSASSFGFKRIEALVLLSVILILIAVGLGPLWGYLTNAKINRAVDDAHTISTLLSQYATDNNGVYPVGEGTPAIGKSEGIARSLLANNYTPDPDIFAPGSTVKYRGTTADFSDFSATNIGWDFTGGATTVTGITSTAPDLLPTVYLTGESVTYPATGSGPVDLLLSGKGPLAREGMVVAYKANNAVFIKGVLAGSTVTAPGFISPDFKDTAKYTQIKP
jgi:type II secretory pathway pseudopilin PulG